MAQVVKIELVMDASGAVKGFRSIDDAGKSVMKTFGNVTLLGDSMSQQVQRGAEGAAASLNKLAADAAGASSAAAQAGNSGAKAVDKIGEHSLNSMDSVRLFRDEFGIHIPRSMEKTMAQSKAVMSVLNAMQGAMVAAGSIGVGVALASQLYDVYKAIRDTDDEVKKFDRDLSAAANKKFFDTASVTMARQQYAELDKELTDLDKKHANHEDWMHRTLDILSPDGQTQMRGWPLRLVREPAGRYAGKDGWRLGTTPQGQGG